jgi:hypothetical protein
MSIEIRNLDGGVGNLIFGSGVINDADYLQALRNHLRQDETTFSEYRYSLADWTQVKEVNVSPEAIRTVAELCKQASSVNSDVVVAVVAKSDLIFGLSRMSQALMVRTGWEHEVFRNKEDAEAWIKRRLLDRHGINDLTMA